MYLSVCRTITVSVQPVWPIVLYVNILLHVSVQFRTDTQLLQHVSTRKSRVLSCDFPICKSATLSVFLIYSLQEVAWFPSILTQPSFFHPVHRKTTNCDALKMKITKFVFKRRFYEFYLFYVSVR
jgi:hypothetical protein